MCIKSPIWSGRATQTLRQKSFVDPQLFYGFRWWRVYRGLEGVYLDLRKSRPSGRGFKPRIFVKTMNDDLRNPEGTSLKLASYITSVKLKAIT